MMYAWATPDYLLWKMSIGQIVMYYNLGMEAKYPKKKGVQPMTAKNMTHSELKKLRDDLRSQYGEIN